jgi:hypothetical protein
MLADGIPFDVMVHNLLLPLPAVPRCATERPARADGLGRVLQRQHAGSAPGMRISSTVHRSEALRKTPLSLALRLSSPLLSSPLLSSPLISPRLISHPYPAAPLYIFSISIIFSLPLSICISFYLSVCLSICLSTYLPIYLSTYLPIYLSMSLSIYLSIYLSINQSPLNMNQGAYNPTGGGQGYQVLKGDRFQVLTCKFHR